MTSFPDATNTGVPAGTTLRSSGGLTLSTPGQVVSGLNINGNVNIHASNVTLENCIIHVTDPTQFAAVAVLGGLTGVVIKNCTIIGPGSSATTQFYGVDVLGNSQVTVDSCNISQVAHGVQVSDGQVVVENNYIHGLNSVGSSHYEDIFFGGSSNPNFSLLIQHNSLINENGWTASVFLQNYFGPVKNVTVNDNLLVGGGYTVYDDSTRSGGPGSNVSFTNNHMGKGQYGYTYFMGSDNPVYTGNVNDGAALAATLNTAANTGGSTSPPASTPATPTIASYSNDSGVAGDGITNDNTLELKGTAAAGSTVKIYDGSTQIGSTTATSTGSWDYITQVLTDAKHTLTAKASNSSGQTSAASSALAVTVDTKAPVAPAIAGDTVNSANQVVANGTAEAGSNIKVYDGTTQVGTATTYANGAWTLTTSSLPVGSHALSATATDAAGNVSAHSAAFDPVIQAPTTGGGQAPSGGQPSSGGQNLVTNGSFETGDYTGWTLGGNYKPLSTGAQTFIVTGAESGKFAAGLGSVGSDGTLSQNVQTTAGQHYAVSFWLANQKSGPNDFTVTWNGQTELALANKSAQGYTQYSFTATGTAGTSHLEFDARNDPAHWSLDNVSVVAVGSQPSQPLAAALTTKPLELTDLQMASNGTATIKGTADVNGQIKLYDGTSLLGSVKAGADGTWNFTTAQLSNAVHTFKAQEVDSTGHVVATSLGNAVLGSSSGNSTLTSTIGNDVLVGQAQSDTFVFAPNFGNDTVKGFTAGGSGHDTIQFSQSVFDTFASVLSHASQVGQDVVISSGNDTLKLLNTKLSALSSQDFHFA